MLRQQLYEIGDCIPEMDNLTCGKQPCPKPMPHCGQCIVDQILSLVIAEIDKVENPFEVIKKAWRYDQATATYCSKEEYITRLALQDRIETFESARRSIKKAIQSNK